MRGSDAQLAGWCLTRLGQASGREAATLAAGTVCTRRHRSGPNPRTRGETGRLEGLPTLPEEEPQGWRSEGADEFRNSGDRALRWGPLPPPSSPLYFFLPLDFKAFRVFVFVLTVTASLFRSLFNLGEFCSLFSFPKQVTELVVASQPSFSLSCSGHRHTLPETDTHRHADRAP